MVLSKIQVSNAGPPWPACFSYKMSRTSAKCYCNQCDRALAHSHTMTPLGNEPFEDTVEKKGEIACNVQFLLFSTVFSTCLDNFLPFSSNLKLSSANSFSLEESKICRLVMG